MIYHSFSRRVLRVLPPLRSVAADQDRPLPALRLCARDGPGGGEGGRPEGARGHGGQKGPGERGTIRMKGRTN